MLRNDRNESFQATQNRTVDNDGSRGRFVCGTLAIFGRSVFQLESLGELEVELDGGALERTTEGISDGDVDLGAVEGSVAWVDLPLAWVLLLESLFELLRMSDVTDTVR